MAAFFAGWRVKLAGRLVASASKAAQPAIPRFPKPPVQGELSLDRIKVVRNDLSDADLEVIASKAPVSTALAGPGRGALEKTEGTQSAWGRVRNRILGAGKP